MTSSQTLPPGKPAKTLRPQKRPPSAWQKPSPETPIASPTNSLPSCKASTQTAKSLSCSALSASSTTSTASTTPFAWNPPNPVKVAALLPLPSQRKLSAPANARTKFLAPCGCVSIKQHSHSIPAEHRPARTAPLRFASTNRSLLELSAADRFLQLRRQLGNIGAL